MKFISLEYFIIGSTLKEHSALCDLHEGSIFYLGNTSHDEVKILKINHIDNTCTIKIKYNVSTSNVFTGLSIPEEIQPLTNSTPIKELEIELTIGEKITLGDGILIQGSYPYSCEIKITDIYESMNYD